MNISSSMLQNSLINEGYIELKNLFDTVTSKKLLNAILATRDFDASLFLSEEEWETSPKSHKQTNPGPGFNVLEKFPEKLDFIEKNAEFRSLLSALLGPDHRILTCKLVCRLSW